MLAQNGCETLRIAADHNSCLAPREEEHRDEARNTLGKIYNWFAEGFDPPDLKEAKAHL
jgi:hypothetical protein